MASECLGVIGCTSLPSQCTLTRLAVGLGRESAALPQFIRSWRNDLEFTPMTQKEINYDLAGPSRRVVLGSPVPHKWRLSETGSWNHVTGIANSK